MSSSPERETLILDAIERAYREDGYEVITHPGPSLLPSIFEDFRPDAIALKDAEKVAIEVVSGRSPSSKSRIDALQTRFAGQSEWRLQLVHTGPPGEPVRELPAFEGNAIRKGLAEVRALSDAGLRRPALIMGWALLEALGRSLPSEASEDLARPQSPARLAERLAREGFLTPDEADATRALIQARNAIVHGDVDKDVSDKDVLSLIKVLENLAGMAPLAA